MHLIIVSHGQLIDSAQRIICYAGPGIQTEPAQAMLEVAARLGPEMLMVCVDFNERVMRMRYGELEAVKQLRAAGIIVNHAQGFETLNRPDFLSSIKEVFPMNDWDKTYKDFTAAGEA